MAKPSASEIKTNIQAQDAAVWNEASERPAGLDKFEDDLAKAIAAAWSDVEGGLAIPTIPVSGGTSGVGGPLAGGIASLSPGSLTSSVSFTVIANKFATTFPDGATEGVLALVDAIANGIGQKFALWAPGYSATLVAAGGTCAWIAPAPPANPTGTPGGWSGGSVTAFPIAGGSSSGDSGLTANSLEAAIGAAANPGKLRQNNNALQPGLAALIKAVAAGFATTWIQWKSKTKISGGNGSGTAAPPLGAITTGAVASPTIS
ncbi:MAG TPA: hypothetical protein VFV34_22610 [Blastocatellia bacterium]|nr:hypothetical protein [Blastocatellia bacterium]